MSGNPGRFRPHRVESRVLARRSQPREATQILSANTAAKDHSFWPAELPFAEAVAFAGVRLLGHQQVTDAYLLGLAIRRGGVLATLDHRIAALTEPRSAERKALETVA